MKATVKCSHCGAEITNLNFAWGKKQWLWMIPALVIFMFPMWRIYRPKGDPRHDLHVTVMEKRATGSHLEILGTIHNTGKTKWENIKLEAEFFDEAGKFMDEASSSISSSVDPGAIEHFKMQIKNPSEPILSDSTRMELKVADAYSSYL